MSEKKLGTCETIAWPHNQDDCFPIKHREKTTCLNWKPSEPVASPQATALDKLGQEAMADGIYDLVPDDWGAAQPAAGTTPRWECTCAGRDKKVWHADKDCPVHGESEGTTPQAERPDYRDMACKYCHRLRVQQSGICEKCQWDNDLGNFASITGRCPHSSDGKHKPVSGNNIMGAAFTECELCQIELLEARAVAPVETPKEKTDARNGHFNNDNSGPVRVLSSDEHNPREVLSVPTRLTAEQFWQTWIDTPLFEELSAKYSPDEWSKIACAFGEAFRDKSEFELRAKLAQQTESLRLMTEIAGHRQGEWDKAETRAEAAEAELAALRERERWIPVEEKLPEFRVPVQVHGGVAELRIDGWWTYMDGEKRPIHWKVTHWKALSAAPEATK